LRITYNRVIKIIFILLFCTACKTAQTTRQIAEHSNTELVNSEKPSNIYIGISPRMKLYESEVYNAKLHIAHQIAFKQKCVVDVGALQITKGKNDFFDSDYGFDYNDANIDEIQKHIDIISVYVFQEITVLIGKDIRESPVKYPKFSRNENNRPQWIHNPQIVRNILGEEYLVGIGISDKYTQMYKGIYAADMAAAQAIASEKNVFIDTYMVDLSEKKYPNYASGNLAMSEGIELNGFYILERWMEPDYSKFYSLGIARKF